ncbi:MAG: bifunctional (p)ppGpp synthetase/guanosine-3',5'-bis(diphosphate) 3'-pyrophosphohydrolase [Azoarcus sp.]|nr:bifunctional (p)ppGpp synthetase/guanosine-3',5'-bis(diphosphate) 3'-pyrophosphohydrolase [Azoarcus sp.]
MVSVTHAVSPDAQSAPIELLVEGLAVDAREHIEEALELARDIYGDEVLGTGESVWTHALGMALISSSLRLDAEARVAAILFAVPVYRTGSLEQVAQRFGDSVAGIVEGLRKLNGLRVVTRMRGKSDSPDVHAQTESLRKMLLAMAADIRVVLLRLASRTQTLRHYADTKSPVPAELARESLDLYAPLANRLGVGQLKWELEDLSFRFLEPTTYKQIARKLDERRTEREAFIGEALSALRRELDAAGIDADLYGRPKHIYSIYNKMRHKKLDFEQVYDIRAVRVLVRKVNHCYKVLDIVNRLWEPIPEEYDDYISKPKGNNYQSLHTAVRAADGRALEVQIRTHEMHRHAEFGVAAHWRYKEGGGAVEAYDEKIALLRSLLSWRDEIAGGADWIEQSRRAALDDTIYLLTPQGRVIDLPHGATPVDFAYRLHTDLGHRCRGAKVDGQLVPLNTQLASGQTVEIVAAKEGGPSRDWLNAQQAYATTHRARTKIRQYFSQLEESEMLARGRSFVIKELQREGRTQTNIEELAERLGFRNADMMFVAAGRGEIGARSVHNALRSAAEVPPPEADPGIVVGRSRSGGASGKVLIVGVGKLLTSLGRCCKPAPPDAIQGFITRGRGVSIHRVDCPSFQNLVHQEPERVIEAEWGEDAFKGPQSVFPVDVSVEANDRQGLLRDISDVLSRDKINVTAVNTLTKKGRAHMRFTFEVAGVAQIQHAISLIRGVGGVIDARRS